KDMGDKLILQIDQAKLSPLADQLQTCNGFCFVLNNVGIVGEATIFCCIMNDQIATLVLGKTNNADWQALVLQVQIAQVKHQLIRIERHLGIERNFRPLYQEQS